MTIAIPVGVALVVLLLCFLSYNRFVSQRQLIANSWANIDTELKRRYDLVPNLVETVKGYATHEREVFEQVTAARSRAMASSGSPKTQAADENQLVAGLRQLLAVSEAYPDLEANAHFLELQRELVNTEDRIQAARRFYNANVRDYNRRVESVPSNLMARIGGFERADYFEIDETVRSSPPPATTFS